MSSKAHDMRNHGEHHPYGDAYARASDGDECGTVLLFWLVSVVTLVLTLAGKLSV